MTRSAEVEGWEGLVKDYIEQHWTIGETFSREDVYHAEPYFAQHYPNNRHTRTKIRYVLQSLAKNGDIEPLTQAIYRYIR
jgi:hypothetical protein